MPTAIILAGPNGVGKTTFASRFLGDGASGFAFLNPDEIARGLGLDLSTSERDMLAGRILLAELDRVVEGRADFVVETTLSSRLYARRIPHWRELGYRVALIYVRLPRAEASVDRVRQRVARGGHGVAESDLMRRYGRSVANLETVYKPLVDDWQVWASQGGTFELLERGGR